MAKANSTRPITDPALEGAITLVDTLQYAMQTDADPARVLKEITATIKPFCQSKRTLGALRSMIQLTGAAFEDDAPLHGRKFADTDARKTCERGVSLLESLSHLLINGIANDSMSADELIAAVALAQKAGATLEAGLQGLNCGVDTIVGTPSQWFEMANQGAAA